MDGQCTAGLEQAGNLCHGACGKDERRGLTDDAADTEDNTGQDAGTRSRQHDAEYRAQTSGAQTERAFAVGIRNRHQRFLSGTHDERQDHDCQRHRTGQQRVSPVQPGDEKQHAEQAVYDGRNAGKRLSRDADDVYQLVSALGILIQVHGSEQAERHGQQQCQRGRFNRSKDSRHHRDVLRGIIPLEQRRLEMRDARHQDIADQEQQHRKGQHSRAVHQTLEHSRRCGAVHLSGLCLYAHCRFCSRDSFSCHASFLLLRTENARLMSRMNTNSTTPVAISASRCRPVA